MEARYLSDGDVLVFTQCLPSALLLSPINQSVDGDGRALCTDYYSIVGPSTNVASSADGEEHQGATPVFRRKKIGFYINY
eukprot:scaffold919_cov96-Skeletonema_dohrnii-CCMP3373.AAC.11